MTCTISNLCSNLNMYNCSVGKYSLLIYIRNALHILNIHEIYQIFMIFQWWSSDKFKCISLNCLRAQLRLQSWPCACIIQCNSSHGMYNRSILFNITTLKLFKKWKINNLQFYFTLQRKKNPQDFTFIRINCSHYYISQTIFVLPYMYFF